MEKRLKPSIQEPPAKETVRLETEPGRHRSSPHPSVDGSQSERSAPFAFGTIERRPIRQLIHSANDRRTDSAAQIDQLAASMSKSKFVNPLLIGADDILMAGHASLRAIRICRSLYVEHKERQAPGAKLETQEYRGEKKREANTRLRKGQPSWGCLAPAPQVGQIGASTHSQYPSVNRSPRRAA